MPIVSVKNLSHSYNAKRTWAVQGINFEVQAEGIVGLVGSNGAGKSTIMNILCGVLNQTEGAVEINGVDMRERPLEARRQLGFLPQDPPLYLDLTIDEYLEHCAKLRLMNKKDIPSAVEEVKQKVSVGLFSKRLLKNLSGGFRRRVGIAQAIIHKPHLVVMDEPTAGLDPNQIIEVRSLIKEIARDRAVIFSTHILPEVDVMCNEVLMIESGRFVFTGTLEAFRKIETADTILTTMEHPPTAGELSSIPGITGVEFLSENRIRLSFNGQADITERIIKQSEKSGWRLKEIMYEQKTLEAVFAKMSRR